MNREKKHRGLASSCLSVCLQGTTRLPLDEFSFKLKYEYFPKMCGEIWCFIKTWTNNGCFTWRPIYIFDIWLSSSYNEQVSSRSGRVNQNTHFMFNNISLYRVSLSLEAPNFCLYIQSNSAGLSFVNTGKQVHLKQARRHFERNLVKDVHHRSVVSRNWLKS